MSNNKERRDESLAHLNKELKARDRKEKSTPLQIALISLAAILVIGGGVWYMATRDSTDEQVTAEESTSPSTQESKPDTPLVPPKNTEFTPLSLTRTTPLADTVTCTYTESGNPSKEVSAPNADNVPATGTAKVTLETNQGNITMELDRSASPCTVNAIEHLAKQGYYDDTICHRLTTSGLYVLQCGDPSGKGSGGPGFTFANEYPTDEATNKEAPVLYPRGSIAMANIGEDTNGSQFFLNYGDSPLPPKYTYFGKIDESGISTIEAIAGKGTKTGGTDGPPAEEVRISKAAVA